MTVATDIAALKARCTALEKRATAVEKKVAALTTRVVKLETGEQRPFLYLKTLAAKATLESRAVTRYVITSGTYKKLLSTVTSAFGFSANSAVATKSQPPSGFYLSATHAAVGAQIGIYGTGFGATQGSSTVTFGERPNRQGWASCARTATVVSWSNTYIVCTVPSMSPGKAGAPDTYHPVYLTIGGNLSPSLDFYINPVTTYTGQNYTSRSTGSSHDVLYDNCTFTSSAYQSAALLISGSPYNITFHNCTIASSSWNGVSINEYSNSGIRDITFSDCTWNYCYRMGLECTTRGTYTMTYQRIGLIGCTFAPCGSQAISFDGHVANVRANCLVKNVHIRGAGITYTVDQPWGSGFEINGTSGFTIQNLDIDTVRSNMLNIQLASSSETTYWVFEDCNFDNRIIDPLQTSAMTGCTFNANNMMRAYFYNCVFWHQNRGVWGYNGYMTGNCSYNTCESCTFGDATRGYFNWLGTHVGNVGFSNN